MRDNLKKILAGIGALAALALGGAAIAGAAGGSGHSTKSSAADTDNVQHENGKDDASEGDNGGKVTGAEADRAKRAALDETGGGTANSFERDGENGATYEVEVTKPDGKTVDVRLDDDYEVVVVEGDGESGHGD